MKYALVLRAGDWSREKHPDLKPGELVMECGHRHNSSVGADSCKARGSHDDSEFYDHAKVEALEGEEPERMKP